MYCFLGCGCTAPGFQTNVRQIRVTPEIAARLRRGEQVSPEEIAEASVRADQEASQKANIESVGKEESAPSGVSDANEWLPDSITSGPKKRGKGKRK